MTLIEADEIFQVWRKWFWPVHFILEAAFICSIPKSFLPFPKNIIEEALEIMTKHYYEIGDHKTAELILTTMPSLMTYYDDEEAYNLLVKNIAIPGMREASLSFYSNFKRDWLIFQDKLEKSSNNQE